MNIYNNKTFCIVGLGLMGGSFARALREFALCPDARIAAIDKDAHIFAIDKDAGVLARAVESGVIDDGVLPSDAPSVLGRADVVIVCLYPAQTSSFLRENAPFFKRGAIVTDISGVKGALESIRPALAAAGAFDFISGHPMAGGEKEGFANARANLFQGRNYILIPAPENKPENIAFLKTLIHALG
ncbi:MAG: prephenate dehydrogenase, partial [Spirochaetaceae bacterium]|nr:prephenate dehydrogenase [Spirochaetaceae bacterium]